MDQFKAFIKTVFIGGAAVVLPVAILFLVFGFIIKFVVGLIEPFTKLLQANFEISGFLANLIVIALILTVSFLIGLLVQTKFGKSIHGYIEQKYFEATPGYKLIKETTAQLMSGKKSPLSKVALVLPFDNETLATAFITHEHADGSFTVFLPMSPPTSGFVFHLKASQVHPIDVTTEEAMRTLLSLGGGSAKLMEKYREGAKIPRKNV